MKNPLEIPEFANEDEERQFWADINLADYYEPEDAQAVSFPNPKPNTPPRISSPAPPTPPPSR